MKILDETGLKFIATKFKELRDSLNNKLDKNGSADGLTISPKRGNANTPLKEVIDVVIENDWTFSDRADLLDKNKVDKVLGKDLSTNDYTNEAKAKVDAIPADPKYTDTIQDLSGYLKKSDVFDNKTFSGDDGKLRDVPFSARQGVWLWDRLDRIAPDGFIDPDKIVPKISIQDREPYWDNNLQGLLLSGALDELFLRTTKLNERKANKTEIKTKLSELTDDATHRLVTDTEKTTWSEKVNNDQLFVKESYEEQKKKYGDEKLIPTVNFIIDRFNGFEKSIRTWAINFITTRLKYYKQQVILTQAEYDGLSSTDKNDASKIYFIKE